MSNSNKFNNSDELALLFKRLFATDDGKAVLEVLEERFQKPALCPMNAIDGMAMAMITQIRVGEDNVIRHIKSLINREIGKNDDRSYTE
jgi:hypothetical protein